MQTYAYVLFFKVKQGFVKIKSDCNWNFIGPRCLQCEINV